MTKDEIIKRITESMLAHSRLSDHYIELGSKSCSMEHRAVAIELEWVLDLVSQLKEE